MQNHLGPGFRRRLVFAVVFSVVLAAVVLAYATTADAASVTLCDKYVGFDGKEFCFGDRDIVKGPWPYQLTEEKDFYLISWSDGDRVSLPKNEFLSYNFGFDRISVRMEAKSAAELTSATKAGEVGKLELILGTADKDWASVSKHIYWDTSHIVYYTYANASNPAQTLTKELAASTSFDSKTADLKLVADSTALTDVFTKQAATGLTFEFNSYIINNTQTGSWANGTHSNTVHKLSGGILQLNWVTTDFISYWSADEGAWGKLIDQGGNANGTFIGAAHYLPTGYRGSGVNLSAAADGVDFGDTNYDVQNFTLGGWFYFDSPDGWSRLISKEDAAAHGYYMLVDSPVDEAFCGIRDVSHSENSTSKTAFTASAWSHWMMSYDTNQLKIYKNGVQVANKTTNAVISTASGNLRLGLADPDIGNDFNSLADEIYFFNHAITDAEINNTKDNIHQTSGNWTSADIDAGSGNTLASITVGLVNSSCPDCDVDVFENSTGSEVEHTSVLDNTAITAVGTGQFFHIKIEFTTSNASITPMVSNLSATFGAAGGGAATGGCDVSNYSGTENWNITSKNTCGNCSFTVNGNISITTGGWLDLTNCTITMNNTGKLGETTYGIRIYKGNLSLTNSTLQSNEPSTNESANGNTNTWISVDNDENNLNVRVRANNTVFTGMGMLPTAITNDRFGINIEEGMAWFDNITCQNSVNCFLSQFDWGNAHSMNHTIRLLNNIYWNNVTQYPFLYYTGGDNEVQLMQIATNSRWGADQDRLGTNAWDYNINLSNLDVSSTTPNYGFSFYQTVHNVVINNLSISGPPTGIELNNHAGNFTISNISFNGSGFGCNLDNHDIYITGVRAVHPDTQTSYNLIGTTYVASHPNYNINMNDSSWVGAPSNTTFASNTAINFGGVNSTFKNISLRGRQCSWDCAVGVEVSGSMLNVTFERLNISNMNLGLNLGNISNSTFRDINISNASSANIQLTTSNHYTDNRFTNISHNATNIKIGNASAVLVYYEYVTVNGLNATSITLRSNSSGGRVLLSNNGNISKGELNKLNVTNVSGTIYYGNITSHESSTNIEIGGLRNLGIYNATVTELASGGVQWYNCSDTDGDGDCNFNTNISDNTSLTTVNLVDTAGTLGGPVNTAPDTPTVNAPATGSDGQNTNTYLNITVIDDDGDLMNCTYLNGADNTTLHSVTNVANGSTSTYQWTGLSFNTTYRWIANCSDGALYSTTGNLTFTTANYAISDLQPATGAIIGSASTRLRYNVTGSEATYNCSAWRDDVLQGNNATAANGTWYYIDTSGLVDGHTYHWNITCTGEGFTQTSDTLTLAYAAGGGGGGGGGGGAPPVVLPLAAVEDAVAEVEAFAAGGSCISIPEIYVGETQGLESVFCLREDNYGTYITGLPIWLLLVLLVAAYAYNNRRRNKKKQK